ncbi:hypothetical protein MG293_014286 [Ovis ammon polii]|uniref:Uncharacterized protein n=1 Tax=Ovis ammon polii TaxID=230172 RepID=A0AAD4Y5S5_OVIAM|nr:hypothetical protein MG293_014286 [Ovis ammon polii]
MTATKAPHPSPELPTREVCALQQRAALPSATGESPGTDAQSQHNHTLTQRRSQDRLEQSQAKPTHWALNETGGISAGASTPRGLGSRKLSRLGDGATGLAGLNKGVIISGPTKDPDTLSPTAVQMKY